MSSNKQTQFQNLQSIIYRFLDKDLAVNEDIIDAVADDFFFSITRGLAEYIDET